MPTCHCYQRPCRCPKYRAYGVYHAHTGELISKHLTRAEANAHKREHHHRVRGAR